MTIDIVTILNFVIETFRLKETLQNLFHIIPKKLWKNSSNVWSHHFTFFPSKHVHRVLAAVGYFELKILTVFITMMDVKFKKTAVMVKNVFLKLFFTVYKAFSVGSHNLSNVVFDLVDFFLQEHNWAVVKEWETIEGKIFFIIEFVCMEKLFKRNYVRYLLDDIFLDISTFAYTLA
jgi:hypothetical protein